MYFILDGQQQQGPFTLDQLRQRGVTADTMVWSQSFGDQTWRHARDVAELGPLLSPYASSYSQFATSTAATPAMRHSGFGIASFIMGLLLGVAMFALVVAAGVMVANEPGGLKEDS